METEVAVDEIDETEVADVAEVANRGPAAAQKIVGWVVAAILVFLAQRDLRKRPSELVRGRVGVWKAVAMVPPGAIAYLLVGRRRAIPPITPKVSKPITA